MRRIIICSVVVVMATMAVLRRDAAAERHGQKEPIRTSFFGRAVTDSGALWYTEYDTVRTASGGTTVDTRYVAADGTPIADLSAEIAGGRYLPKTRFLDHRDNYRYAIEPQIDRRAVLITQQLDRAAEQRRTLGLRADLMTFQGVVLYIIDQRMALQRGESLSVQSIVPSRMTSYGVRIYKRASRGNLLTVRLEMSAVAYRFFTTPSDLTIDVASGRLLEFSGPSNLLDARDRPVRVHIIYEYQ